MKKRETKGIKKKLMLVSLLAMMLFAMTGCSYGVENRSFTHLEVQKDLKTVKGNTYMYAEWADTTKPNFNYQIFDKSLKELNKSLNGTPFNGFIYCGSDTMVNGVQPIKKIGDKEYDLTDNITLSDVNTNTNTQNDKYFMSNPLSTYFKGQLSQLKGGEHLVSITYPKKVYKANGVVQSDGQTVIYDLNKLTESDRIWACFDSSIYNSSKVDFYSYKNERGDGAHATIKGRKLTKDKYSTAEFDGTERGFYIESECPIVKWQATSEGECFFIKDGWGTKQVYDTGIQYTNTVQTSEFVGDTVRYHFTIELMNGKKVQRDFVFIDGYNVLKSYSKKVDVYDYAIGSEPQIRTLGGNVFTYNYDFYESEMYPALGYFDSETATGKYETEYCFTGSVETALDKQYAKETHYRYTIYHHPYMSKTSVKALGNKKIKVSWKSFPKQYRNQISGIEVQVSTDKNFKKGVKKYTVSKSKTSKTITNLKANKKYYVRVRSYVVTKSGKYKGTKVYSPWDYETPKNGNCPFDCEKYKNKEGHPWIKYYANKPNFFTGKKPGYTSWAKYKKLLPKKLTVRVK